MNIKHQFYKAYYKNMDPRIFLDERRDKRVESKNEELFISNNENLFRRSRFTADQLQKYQLYNKLANVPPIQLVTTYPGLVIGTGYTHETKNKGELKLGFHFDHTTGLPEIPGSSIKGMIRHAFPRRDQPQTKEPVEIKAAKAAYIIQLLGLQNKVDDKNQLKWVTLLEKQIFENLVPDPTDDKKEIKSGKPADVFFPAYITNSDQADKIIGPDTLTPHNENPLKNPNPLPFLKVLPGVTWTFSFQLFNTKIGDIEITVENKRQLFQNILLHLGVGAKTNVGYGHFAPLEQSQPVTENQTYQIPDYQFPASETDGKNKNNDSAKSTNQSSPQQKSQNAKPTETPGEARHATKIKSGKEAIIDGVVRSDTAPYKVNLYMDGDRIEEIILETKPFRKYKTGQVIQVRLQVKKDGSINGKVMDNGPKKPKK